VGYATPDLEQTEQTAVIRDVVEHNITEPNALWAELEAKGIDATPGVVHQALTMPTETVQPGMTAPAAAQGGLSADDLVLLGSLVAKAGGLDNLCRVLAAWQQTLRQ
jgi:hypothetical protein